MAWCALPYFTASKNGHRRISKLWAVASLPQRQELRTRERITHARKVSRVMMTADAREVWEHAYETLSQSRPGLLGAILGRAEAQTVRLALIYALLDGRDEIGVEHLNGALAVWSYCEASASYIFGGIVSGGTEDVIAAALKQAGETGMTRTEIRDLFGRHRKRHEIDAALAALAAAGKAKRSLGAITGGRPPTVWIEQARRRERSFATLRQTRQ